MRCKSSALRHFHFITASFSQTGRRPFKPRTRERNPSRWPFHQQRMNLHHNPKEQLIKHLLQLAKEQSRLWRERQNLPLVKLAEPYQSGGVRYFVLTERATQRRDADILETILRAISVKQWCWRPDFRYRRCRRSKRVATTTQEQNVQRIRLCQWHRLRWPDAWFHYFKRIPHPLPSLARLEFLRPELFELKHEPHYVTHVKDVSPAIERRLYEIERELRPHGGSDKIHHLKGGRSYRRWLPRKSPEKRRADESFQFQLRELRSEGVIIAARERRATTITPSIVLRTTSIEVMLRAFNAQSRERYPGGSPIIQPARGTEIGVTAQLKSRAAAQHHGLQVRAPCRRAGFQNAKRKMHGRSQSCQAPRRIMPLIVFLHVSIIARVVRRELLRC